MPIGIKIFWYIATFVTRAAAPPAPTGPPASPAPDIIGYLPENDGVGALFGKNLSYNIKDNGSCSVQQAKMYSSMKTTLVDSVNMIYFT